MSDNNSNKRGFDEMRGPVPVTVLSGFLGAGKTTLLKYILETKHKEDGGADGRGGKAKNGAFRCAVIVNDMAELNIDERLIVDQSDVVQSNDVVALQNGCVCCTLQNDLVDQIIKLAASGNYDYMILEASGVSEPAEIAKLFREDCEEDHDHTEHHGHDDKPRLSEVSHLDTLVTVVDASALLETNQDLWLGTSAVAPSQRAGKNKNNLSQLMAEQVEYANVILLNKMDLVTETQMEEVIKTRIRPLNAQATLLTCQNSRIDDVHKVVDTRSYRHETFGFEQLVNELQVISDEKKVNDDNDAVMKNCCVESKSKGLKACCPSKAKKKTTFDSGLSQVVLADQSASQATRHDSRFGITSFLYKARRPFHPDRFNKEFISKYFLYYDPQEEEECEESEQDRSNTDKAAEPEQEQKKEEEEDAAPEAAPEPMDIYIGPGMGMGAAAKYGAKPDKVNGQVEEGLAEKSEAMKKAEEKASVEAYREVARQRQANRKQDLGQLLRTKGFIWLADSHDMLTTMSHAGNLVTLDSPGHWTALNPKAYHGNSEEKAKLCKQWMGQWKDRRQELVFIGQKLDHKFIQALLDECLLDDEDFEMGVDYWKATMGDNVLEIAASQDE